MVLSITDGGFMRRRNKEHAAFVEGRPPVDGGQALPLADKIFELVHNAQEMGKKSKEAGRKAAQAYAEALRLLRTLDKRQVCWRRAK